MALIESNFFSRFLCRFVSVNIIIPEFSGEKPGARFRSGDKFPVLYLLHGMGEDHTSWCRYTNIERYAQKKGIAVVMPQMDNGYYCDLPEGGSYFRFYTEELPDILTGILPISDDGASTFIAGAGTGGYGALLAGLRKPQQYGAVAGLSSRTEGRERCLKKKAAAAGKWSRMMFGDHMEYYTPEVHEPSVLLENAVKEQIKLPEIYMVCGSSDDRVQENRSFRNAAERAGVPVVYKEENGGHDWEFWDLQIRHILDWLPV